MLLLVMDKFARLHTDTIPKNLLIHLFGDSCFVSDCFMPDTGNKSVNTTSKNPVPYIWSVSLGKTDKHINTTLW